jgi:hypothetical protein
MSAQGNHRGLPLHVTGETRFNTLGRHRECYAKGCPYG